MLLKKIKVRRYKPEDYQKWNDFIMQSSRATFLFHRDFIEYHQDRFEDFSIVIEEQDSIKAILPLHKKDVVVYSHLGLTYGGFIYNGNEKFHQVKNIWQEVLLFFKSQDIKEFYLKKLPYIYLDFHNQIDDYILFILKAKHQKTETLSVVEPKDLTLSKDRKEGCKKGEKHQLKIEETNDFSTFWKEILIPTLEKKHQKRPVHSLEEITYLKNKFPNNIRQFNIYHKEKLVAGTTIFESKWVAHSQYIGSNEEKNKLGSLDFLHHYLIKEVFKDKKYFDFGISNEDDGKKINKGLLYWKEGFNTFIVCQEFYKIKVKNVENLDTFTL